MAKDKEKKPSKPAGNVYQPTPEQWAEAYDRIQKAKEKAITRDTKKSGSKE